VMHWLNICLQSIAAKIIQKKGEKIIRIGSKKQTLKAEHMRKWLASSGFFNFSPQSSHWNHTISLSLFSQDDGGGLNQNPKKENKIN
jgi:hypothetical protein